MSARNLTQTVIESGKSAALRAHFDLLDQTEVHGVAKFAPDTLRWVQRVVSCRSYGPPLHELCHLLRMAESRAGGPVDLLWTPMRATAGNVRAWFQQSPAVPFPGGPAVTLTESGVHAAYRDGTFEVTFARAADLIALAEFLVTALGFRPVDEALGRLSAAGAQAAGVGEASNALARALYAHLGEHLPSVQEGRLTRHLVDWLSDADGDFDTRDIDDEAILAFWEAKCGEEGLRAYTACVRHMLRLVDLVEAAAARRGLDAARPIGPDVDAGEVDPAQVEALLDSAAPADDPLSALGRPPADQVKALNGRERDRLAWSVAFGRHAERLLLTLLRVQVFGPWQARLSQRRRVRAGEVAALLDAGPEFDHAGALAEFRALASHLSRVRLAALAALLRAGHPGAAAYLVALLPPDALTRLVQPAAEAADGPDAPEDTDEVWTMVQPVLQRLADGRTGDPACDRRLAEANKALRGLAREGFRPPYAADGLAAAEAPLGQLARQLAQITAAGARGEAGWPARHAADTARFTAVLSRLYGEADT